MSRMQTMKLELINVDLEKPPIVLHEFPVIVGLDRGADICLDDSAIGHYHCMIDFSDDSLMVWDLGTRSGTYINGNRISQNAPLQPGDELALGKTRFLVKYDDGKPRTSTRADHPRRREQPLPV